MKEQNNTGFGSICVKNTNLPQSTKPHHLPICATSSFEFASVDEGIEIFTGEKRGHVYGRYGNPTIDAASQKIIDLESHNLDVRLGATMTSSGMSAIATLILGVLEAGDVILSQGNIYGGTIELLDKVVRRCGIQLILTDFKDLELVEQQLKENPSIKLLFIESPANPVLQCQDFTSLARLARNYGVKTAVDNTFATPYLQQPFNTALITSFTPQRNISTVMVQVWVDSFLGIHPLNLRKEEFGKP